MNKEKLGELVRYGFFGGLTTAINLLLFAVFKELGMYYIVANTVSYVIAVIINYVLNVLFVFKGSPKKGKAQWIQLGKFLLTRAGSLLVDNTLFFCLVTLLSFPVYPSRIGLSFVIILGTYVINKALVFKKEH